MRRKKKPTRNRGTITHVRRFDNGFAFRQFGFTVWAKADAVAGGLVVLADKNNDSVTRAVVPREAIEAICVAIDKARELGAPPKAAKAIESLGLSRVPARAD